MTAAADLLQHHTGHVDDGQWRPIRDFEGSYEVSRDGRVRSLDRAIEKPSGRWGRPVVDHWRSRELRAYTKKNGLRCVWLYDASHRRHWRGVPNLVREAFGEQAT